MSLSLEFHPADVFGLSALQRSVLAPGACPGGVERHLLVARSLDSIQRPEERFSSDERAQLVEGWAARLAALEPPVAALDGVRSLSRPGSSIVLAEALPWFLGGPLAALYEAIHAIRVARELGLRFGTPVVPVLWVLGDEHEPSGVHQRAFLNENLDLRRVSVPAMERAGRPFSRTYFDETRHRLTAVSELVRELLWEGAHTRQALELFLPRHGESFSSAFSRTLSDALGPLGLVVLEPDWIRADLSRALARLVSVDPRAAREEAVRRMQAAGLWDDLDTSDPAHVYRLDDGGYRMPLLLGGDGYRFEGESGSRTPLELAAEVVQDPEHWSAAPFLRSLCQDAVLPVVARVGGAELLAVEALNRDLREQVGLPPVPLVSRLSATLVESESARALVRLGIGVREVLSGSLEARATRRDVPADAASAQLEEVGSSAAAALLALRPLVAQIDEGLAVQLKRTSKQVRDLIGKLAKRTGRASGNRRGKERRHARRLANSLLPDGMPQEQVLGTLAFVARYGVDWIGELVQEIDPFPIEHLVVRFEESGGD